MNNTGKETMTSVCDVLWCSVSKKHAYKNNLKFNRYIKYMNNTIEESALYTELPFVSKASRYLGNEINSIR